ncbi:MAG: hypothetical protein WBF93_22130, partial [Pirellulales bacterium]
MPLLSKYATEAYGDPFGVFPSRVAIPDVGLIWARGVSVLNSVANSSPAGLVVRDVKIAPVVPWVGAC